MPKLEHKLSHYMITTHKVLLKTKDTSIPLKLLATQCNNFAVFVVSLNIYTCIFI